ncbi:hypothetical protein SDC9_158207 [bioreactor metagenome]|uniref:Uncharacterized protein n=1 Tax=bioreactor metagenome TaxID=1076179 RepID=A0A645FAI4_9ZZZZ
MPMTTHVTGLASRAAVKLHTEPMSGVRAPFTSRNPALIALKAPIVFVMTRPTAPTTAMMVPATVRKPPIARTTIMMILTSSWFFSIQEPAFVSTCSPLPMRLLMVGSRLLPIDSVTLWMRCCSRSNFSGSVSLIAEAICCATPVPEPRESYILTMFVCRSSTFPYMRSMSATASVSPKASCSFIFSAASIVSPNLPRSLSIISGILKS